MLQRDTGHVTCEAVAGKAMTARGASPPASASLPPPTSSRWEDVPDTMEHTLLSPTCPSAPHLHPSAPSSSIGSPSPAALPPPLVPPSNPLFLSIDASSVTTVRACILDHQLCVVWTEQVLVDTDLPEYGCARLTRPSLLCHEPCTHSMVMPSPQHPPGGLHAGRRRHLPLRGAPARPRPPPREARARLPGPDPPEPRCRCQWSRPGPSEPPPSHLNCSAADHEGDLGRSIARS